MYLFKSFDEKKEILKKESTVGFEPVTLRLQILCLTPRLRVMMQIDDSIYEPRAKISKLFRKDVIDALKSTQSA